MAKAQREFRFTIATGATTSGVIELNPTESVVSMDMPAIVTGTYFNIKASTGGGTMHDVWNSGDAATAAAQFKIYYAASRFIRCNPADLYGMQFIQFVSDAVQLQDTTITLVLGVLE